jgi:hypothetical protein
MDYSEWKFQQLNGNKTDQYDELAPTAKAAFVALAILLTSLFLLIENWLLMIFIGTLHSVFNFIPALGFWAVFWINLLIGIVFNIIRQNIKASK